MNKLIVIGNLGRDPEMRYLPSGQAVTNFSVASTRKYKASSGEQVKETTWVKCACWGKLAEIASKYLVKGKQVYVEGRLTPDENGNPHTFARQDGTAGAAFEMTVENLQFLGSASEGNGNGEHEAASEEVIPL